MSKKNKKSWTTKQRAIFIPIISLASVLGFLITLVGSYVLYVMAQYYRIPDNYELTEEIIKSTGITEKPNEITNGQELTIVTYNIGFGAYDRDYDFFMDSGEMFDGRVIVGTHSRASSEAQCYKNTYGALNLVKKLDPDFAIIQEIDTDSDRSYHINQYQEFIEEIGNKYDAVMASNFHTAYLAYPFNEPIGRSNSGVATFSKYKMSTAVRRSYPVDNSFPARFFDLDRCFSVVRYPLSNGKELVIGNSHMSAYDEGGLIRAQQMDFLCQFLEQEKDNYVIVGGDFNHDIAHSVGYFPTMEINPVWVREFDADDLPENYTMATSLNAPTCRAAEMPYTYGINYLTVIDGFIINSAKINNIKVTNIDNEFEFSDHNPVKMTFSLNLD